ncbi:MAG TPA: glycosyltransferase family 39 protein [Gemmatimonadales bacterium]|jgi:hypothetical protein|nr:glycosyltransferase family 39 protein [Gemmatimonadales bacterium]
MSRTNIAFAGALALLGVLLPVDSVAAFLAGSGSPMLVAVAHGVWVFKLMLLVHAALILALPRLSIARTRSAALAPWVMKDAPRPSRWEWAVLGLLLLIGGLIRMYRLPNGLWFDEIQTLVDYVRLPMGHILTTYNSQNQHLFYSVLAGATTGIFGESAATLRLPAAVFGVASLAAMYFFARMVTGRIESLLATALLTFSYHHVWFSQNARGYTGLLLFTLLASGFFVRLVAGRYQRPWLLVLGYGLAMALAAYTHITAVLVAVAHFVIWLILFLRAPRPRGLDAWLPCFGILVAATLTLQLYALVIPEVLGTVLHPPLGAAATAWQSPVWFATEAVRGLSQGVPGGWFTLAAGLVVVGAGLVSYWKKSRALLAIMVLPAIISGAALLALQHNLWPRFFFFSAGFAVLILVRGGFALVEWLLPARLQWVAPLVTALVVLASATTVPKAWYPKQDFSGAMTWLDRMAGGADAVATVDLTRYPYQEFYRTDYVPVDSLAALEHLEQGHRRTWVLYTFPIRLAAVQPAIWERLQQHYTVAARFPGTVGGGAIVVMKSQ